MISDKIDLTEYGDFRDGNPHNALLFPIDITLARQLCDMESMSLDDYKIIERHMEIFGKKWHDNRKYEIFGDVYFKRYLSEYGHICPCCGKEIRRPWSAQYGICEECNSYVGEHDIYLNYGDSRMTSVGLQSKFIPWRRTMLIPDLARSGLFDLR